MAKLTNVRERVHQPFRDTLIRTSGFYTSVVQDRTELFTQAGKDDGASNLKNGSTLPSDQSMVVLALRVFTWFRASVARCGVPLCRDNQRPCEGVGARNGDQQLAENFFSAGGCDDSPLGDNAAILPNYQDVYRLHWQAEEQLLWSFGSGQKFSLTSMPTAYFPYGGGLSGDMGGVGGQVLSAGDPNVVRSETGLHWQNGTPDHSGILRLARAILLPPRQNVLCQAQIVRLPDGGNGGVFGATQGSRSMLSLTDNLNVEDMINKVISFTFDGLFSRDVQ